MYTITTLFKVMKSYRNLHAKGNIIWKGMNSDVINETLECSLFNGNQQDIFPFALEEMIQGLSQ